MTGPDPTSQLGPDREPDRERLRALLEDAVADVQPSPALDRIRARTKVTPMRRTRPWLLVTAGAVAATAVTIAAVSLADGRSPQADPSPGPAGTSTADPTGATTDEPSGNPSPTPSGDTSDTPSTDPTPTQDDSPTPTSTPPAPGGTSALPVYFVGDTPAGPRLFREFHSTPAGGTSAGLLDALDAAVRGESNDPDYRSGWPAGFDVSGAGWPSGEGEGPYLLVALKAHTGLAERPAGTTEAQARLAVQQLVYTAQAVVQHRWPVQFTANNGLPLTRLLGLDVSQPVAEAPAMQVQAPVWVISPQDGDVVGHTFTVEGRGAFFEATVAWQLLRPDGTVARKGFTTATECCTLAPYSFTVTARPGDYVLRVYDADVSGGESPGEQQDTKRITVR